MIVKRAIKQFLSRSRQDFRVYKTYDKLKLNELMSELPIRPPIWQKLHIHQRACFLIGVLQRRFGFLCDPSTGKTLISIALIAYFYRLEKTAPVLILAPRRVNKSEWVDEIVKHCPGLSYTVLTGSSEDKWRQLEETKAIVVIESLMGFVRMMCELKEVKKKGKQTVNKLLLSDRLVRRAQKRIKGLIIDESHNIKNSQRLPYRVCKQVSKTVKFLFLLTGTPFGKDPTDLWSQMFLIDKGYTLGETLGIYREAFFKKKERFWGGGCDYTFDKNKEELLHDFLANSSIRYEANEADLPKLVSIKKYVTLPSATESYANKAKQAVLLAKGNYREMRNAFLRMRQISSGFLGYYDDEAGDKAQFMFPFNPKMDMLLSILESIPENRKVIIFYDFIVSGNVIADELKKLKLKFAWIAGKTKDPGKEKSNFINDANVTILLLQNTMVAGLNLQSANYSIYYESPVAVIDRKQSEWRTRRPGSKFDKVFIIDLITRDTFDERILEFHESGQDLFDSIVNGL